MGLLKEKKKKKSAIGSRLAGGGSGSQISPLRPRYVETLPRRGYRWVGGAVERMGY